MVERFAFPEFHKLYKFDRTRSPRSKPPARIYPVFGKSKNEVERSSMKIGTIDQKGKENRGNDENEYTRAHT
jgi:hypothetical protein